MTHLDPHVLELAEVAAAGEGPIVFLTGAGVSAESGIPTFRGEGGYWTVGSENYRAEDLATRAAFARMPDEVWAWYLYRRGVCEAARPNAAHAALVTAERRLGARFLLVTQNVDGMHGRAGQSAERTYEVHGRIDRLRCGDDASTVRPLPDGLPVDWPKARRLDERERAMLRCCEGGRWARPHVLWFDESYDESNYRFHSSLDAAARCAALVVIGTSGATTLPTRMVELVAARGAPLFVVNADPSPFTDVAAARANGAVLLGAATRLVPPLVDALAPPHGR